MRATVAMLLALFVGLLLFLVCLSFVASIYYRDNLADAIYRDDVAAVEFILNKDPTLLEKRDALEFTPLLCAAYYGRDQIATILIDRGADIHAKWDLASSDDSDWNALHVAAIHGHVAVSIILIRHGIGIKAHPTKAYWDS